MIRLRQSTASQEVPLGHFVDDADGKTAETALTIANTDIKVWKSGATTLANKNSGGATHISGGIYYAVLDATDTDTIGPLVLFVAVSGALAVRLECEVLDEAVYDAIFGTTALATATNITAAAGIAVSSIGNNVITAASIASDAITDAKVADGAIDAATFAAGAITATVIADGAIDAATFAANAITSTVLANDCITDAKVASDVTIASVTGAVGSVTGAVGSVTGNVGGNVVGSVASVAGSVGGNLAGSVLGSVAGSVASVAGAVGSVTGAVGSVTGAVGSVTGNVGGNVTGSVGSLATQAKADVNAEVLDVLNTDTFAEPGQEAPAATNTLVKKIGYLFKFLRNKVTQTASTLSVFADDATTVDQKSTVSDDGTTYTRGEIASGP